jgi:hypothetical protein
MTQVKTGACICTATKKCRRASMCVLPTYVLPSAHREKYPLHGIMIDEASKLVINNSSQQLYIQDNEKLASYWEIF